MKNTLSKISNIKNHRFLSLVIFPLTMIIFGTLLGGRQSNLQIFSFLLLYLFFLLISILEVTLIKNMTAEIKSPTFLKQFFWISVMTVLVFFFISVNWVSTSLLLLYLLFTLSSLHPKLKMEQTVYYPILQLFFKVIIINILAYYIQSGYVEKKLLWGLLPLIFLFLPILLHRQKSLFQEKSSRYQIILNKYFSYIIISSYLVGILVIFLYFNLIKLSFVYQTIFILPVFTIVYLLLFKKIRIDTVTDNVLNIFLFITVLLYTLLLKIPVVL